MDKAAESEDGEKDLQMDKKYNRLRLVLTSAVGLVSLALIGCSKQSDVVAADRPAATVSKPAAVGQIVARPSQRTDAMIEEKMGHNPPATR